MQPPIQSSVKTLTFFLKLFRDVIFTAFIRLFLGLFGNVREKSVTRQLALITGCANGIGQDIAIRLADVGCNIAVVDIDMVNAAKTVQELLSLGVKAKAFKADVGNLKDVERLKDEVEGSLGTIDILVNNAGIHLARHVTEENVDRLQKMMNTNLMSHIWVRL